MSTSAVLLPLLAGALAIPEADAQFIMNMGSGDRSGSLIVELLVGPDHAVEDCKVWSGASERGAERLCDRARKMEIPKTATDGEGSPLHGFVYVARVPRDDFERARGPLYPIDMHVGVQDIPGRETRKMVNVTVLVDESGTVSQCETSGDNDAAFAAIACQQATTQALPMVHDRNGVAVRYIRTLIVVFVEEVAN